MMPLPRFSLRTTLVLLTAGALFFALTGFGQSGGAWALAVTAALASLVACLALHAVFYLLIDGLSRVLGTEVVTARSSRGALTPVAAPISASVHDTLAFDENAYRDGASEPAPRGTT